eukprot:2708732-Rhodomonas_salina.1
MGGKALFVCAGAYSPQSNLNFSFQVEGEAVVISREMSAVAEAVTLADPTQSLTIFTDCLTLIQIVSRWTLADFTPYVESEGHWDILSVLLEGLRSRQAPTCMVWVKAHVGDYGNELADRAADQGCQSEDVRFHSPHTPFQLYSLEGQEMLSQHGWNQKVLTHASTLVGTHTSHCLCRSEAESTALCTLEHMTHSLLGQTLISRDGLTDPEIWSLLQIRGNSYPTASVVSHNKKGGVSSTCPLCHGGDSIM